VIRRVVRSEKVGVPGPAGQLEAAVDSADSTPRGIAVVCHPHPLQRGTMQNKVVTTLARVFVDLGMNTLRFNFRGVGASEGSFGDGIGERDDARAAVGWVRERWPGLPLYLGGFSFGAAIVLGIAAELGPKGLVTVAPPVDKLPGDFVAPECAWLLVHGAADEVVPVDSTVSWLRTLRVRPNFVVLEGVGHFFHGQLRVLEETVRSFFAPDLPVSSPSA
jgi:alpha/beta superfamily hydrolase